MQALSLLTDPNAWAALVTLTALEIVLGIDNLVFISVLTSRLAEDKARRARLVGLALAFIFRVITHEIHREVEARERPVDASGTTRSFAWIVVQLVAVDLVFSLDSILTAIGMAEHLEVMIAAVVIAMVVMYAAANPVGAFIAAHPTTRMLALAFLVLIGVALVADGFEFHIPRGYIYFAMAFAAAVEACNVMARRTRQRRRRR